MGRPKCMLAFFNCWPNHLGDVHKLSIEGKIGSEGGGGDQKDFAKSYEAWGVGVRRNLT